MRRQIIALQGVSNVGKTTTIGIAYRYLAQHYERLLQPSTRTRKEITAILRIEGVKVGFTSIGDIPETLRRNLLRLTEDGCEIIICAVHTRGQTVEVVKQLASHANPPYEVEWIEKLREPEHDKANNRIANEIIGRIRDTIGAMAIP